MLRIRPLEEEDRVDVLRIQDECYPTIEPESWESLRAKLAASPGTCFAAELLGETVAYLITVPIAYPALPALGAPAFAPEPAPDTLYLHDLAVSRDGRGSGAGQALVQAALEAGRGLGLRRACLVAIQGSATYWRRFGFRETPPPPQVADKLASYGPTAQLMTAPL